MKNLKNDIKTNEYKNIYLFYGEEGYIIKKYEAIVKERLISNGNEMMNMDLFEGKGCNINSVIDAASTMPFLSEKRLVILKGTRLFVPGRKDDTEKFAGFVKEIPETTVLLCMEAEVDKRTKLYKLVNEAGRAVEFKKLSEKELITWITSTFKEYKKNISSQAVLFFLRTVGDNMEAIHSEILKLAAYKGEELEITREDIEKICIKSLETKIFDLVDAIGNKNAKTALDIYANLMLYKEQPIMILAMIARQFRFIFQAKCLKQRGASDSEIAASLSQRSFVISACLGQSKNFSIETLKKAIEECLVTDINIKTGKMNDKLAVELLIMKYI